jgi:hypothetical protein
MNLNFEESKYTAATGTKGVYRSINFPNGVVSIVENRRSGYMTFDHTGFPFSYANAGSAFFDTFEEAKKYLEEFYSSPRPIL